MKKITFEEIREKGLLLYEYVRGSQVYGTSTPQSDVDHGGIFIAPINQLFGLGLDYADEVSDEKHDTCWWELGKFMNLILKSNPTVLEALFIPEDKIIYEHPLMTEIKKHRDMFVTKQAFNPLGGYAVSQIKKARGQNKKIHWDIEDKVRRPLIDFVYVEQTDAQGSENIVDWLNNRGLEQRNVGLNNIPKCPTNFGVYYDYGQHIKLNNISKEYFTNPKNISDKFIKFCIGVHLPGFKVNDMSEYSKTMADLYDKISVPKGKHCGMVSENADSTELRLSSIKKHDKPICHISYNKNDFEQHCREYKEYLAWQRTRNKARYENNLSGYDKDNPELFYDAKNIMHCFRLIAMATEVARGEGMKLCRTGIDADFLLDVRNRKYTYTELVEMLDKKKEIMDEAIQSSTIPDEIDVEFVNNLLLSTRETFYFKNFLF